MDGLVFPVYVASTVLASRPLAQNRCDGRSRQITNGTRIFPRVSIQYPDYLFSPHTGPNKWSKNISVKLIPAAV